MDGQPSNSGSQPQSPPAESETKALVSEPTSSTPTLEPSDNNKLSDAAIKDTGASGSNATPPDPKASLQTIIGHLNEVVSLVEKATTLDDPTLTADGRSALEKLQTTLEEHVKIVRGKETGLLQSETPEELALPTLDDFEKYDQETKAIISKLEAILNPNKDSSGSDSAPSNNWLDDWYIQFWEPYGDKAKTTEIKDNKPDTLAIALAEEEAYSNQTIYLDIPNENPVPVLSEGNRTGELVIVKTEPITKELLDRVSYAQLTSKSVKEEPLAGPTSPAEASSPISENAGEEKTKANEGGSWFDLAVLVENPSIPRELKDGGDDDLKLAQETKDVLIRVLYGGLWIPKGRSGDRQMTEEPTEIPAASNSSTNTSQENPTQRRLTLLEELLGPEKKKDQLRWKSHDNVHSTQDVKTIRGAVFGRNHEIWKSVKVGDVLGVMACARGEGWKNQIERVELKFWQDSDR